MSFLKTLLEENARLQPPPPPPNPNPTNDHAPPSRIASSGSISSMDSFSSSFSLDEPDHPPSPSHPPAHQHVGNLVFDGTTLGNGNLGTVQLARRMSYAGEMSDAVRSMPMNPPRGGGRRGRGGRFMMERRSFSSPVLMGEFNHNLIFHTAGRCREGAGGERRRPVEGQEEQQEGQEQQEQQEEVVAVKIYSKSILKRIRNFSFHPKRHSAHANLQISQSDSVLPSRTATATATAFLSNTYHGSTPSSSPTTPRRRSVQITTALQNVEREIALMKMMRHPNIVSLLEVIDSVDSDALYLVLEYVPLGEIMTYLPLQRRYRRMARGTNGWALAEGLKETAEKEHIAGLNQEGYFHEEAAALFFVDVMHGLAYLHQHRVCHRDLKPENILLHRNGVVKIGDFGVSHFFEEECQNAHQQRRWSLGERRKDGDGGCVTRSCVAALSNSNNKKPGGAASNKTNKNKKSTNAEKKKKEEEEDTFCDNVILTRDDTDRAFQMDRMAQMGTLSHTEGTYCFWSPEMCRPQEELTKSPSTSSFSSSASGGGSLKTNTARSPRSFSGYASDVWAAGVCLYIFASGRLPFHSDVPTELFPLIYEARVPYVRSDDDDGGGEKKALFSEGLTDLLTKILERDPEKRAGIGECLRHSFCEKARNQRISDYGEELSKSNSKKLVVREGDVRNAFSITKRIQKRLTGAFTRSKTNSTPNSRVGRIGSFSCLSDVNTLNAVGTTSHDHPTGSNNAITSTTAADDAKTVKTTSTCGSPSRKLRGKSPKASRSPRTKVIVRNTSSLSTFSVVKKKREEGEEDGLKNDVFKDDLVETTNCPCLCRLQ